MEIIFYEVAETTSTNDLSKQLLSQLNKSALTVVYTWNQTGGRGQFGKSWSSTNKDITASFCFFVSSQNIDSSYLIRPGAEAIIELTKTFGIKELCVKWPNDVLVKQRKLSGILCETIPVAPESTAIILGIGLNVNSSLENLKNVGQPATSLLIETGIVYNLDNVLSNLSTKVRSHVLSTMRKIV
ncbi:biotin--[acetyl-CoA-carboxylase] ligase [Chlamydiifrater volucris]|uniref:biotin--[acetyl-CoA-carboxylase] ligase n=1 Tax=Chlamydiifrater volucris TaxID=2681470 RepID=UPI001BCB5720|nr:biotin--[acetyl-CoA-carboxylase] ligase [Chlamydiifrater volucris]